MPAPGGYHLMPDPFSLRREFVIFPRRLHKGGWIWGTTYHRRVERGDRQPSGLIVWRVKDEYFTEIQAIMARLNGEE